MLKPRTSGRTQNHASMFNVLGGRMWFMTPNVPAISSGTAASSAAAAAGGGAAAGAAGAAGGGAASSAAAAAAGGADPLRARQ